MRILSRSIIKLMIISLLFLLCYGFGWSSDKDSTRDPKYLESYAGEKAERVGSDACIACHDSKIPKTPRNHIQLLDGDKTSSIYGFGCEGCHGAGGNHNGDPAGILMPPKMPFKKVAELCSKCHSSLRSYDLKGWYLSEHFFTEMDCLSCHSGHSENQKYLLNSDKVELCLNCHQRKRAEFKMRSHHPVEEKQISCISCHNPHSGKFEKQLKDQLDNLCFECHGDKEGPFTYDHDVSMSAGGEGCLTCHFVHGSHTDALLRYPQRLCLRCHNEMTGENHFSGTCWKSGCHSDIHGSYTNPLFFESESDE